MGEPISTELFLALCYRSKLTKQDLEDMSIGMCLDYIDEFIEMQKPKEEKKRKANQSDFDSF